MGFRSFDPLKQRGFVVILSLADYQLRLHKICVLGVIFGMTYFDFNYLDSCSVCMTYANVFCC